MSRSFVICSKMALSTLRLAARPYLLGCGSLQLASRSVPMATSAEEQMKAFWVKNQSLKRPNSPWIIYNWELPMMTSLTHRFTGISMGLVLYGGSMALFMSSGDFTSYVEMVKAMDLSPAVLFPVKGICAFPLVYHYVNGIRHLAWDAGKGYELNVQYKTGWITYATATLISALIASAAYW